MFPFGATVNTQMPSNCSNSGTTTTGDPSSGWRNMNNAIANTNNPSMVAPSSAGNSAALNNHLLQMALSGNVNMNHIMQQLMNTSHANSASSNNGSSNSSMYGSGYVSSNAANGAAGNSMGGSNYDSNMLRTTGVGPSSAPAYTPPPSNGTNTPTQGPKPSSLAATSNSNLSESNTLMTSLLNSLSSNYGGSNGSTNFNVLLQQLQQQLGGGQVPDTSGNSASQNPQPQQQIQQQQPLSQSLGASMSNNAPKPTLVMDDDRKPAAAGGMVALKQQQQHDSSPKSSESIKINSSSGKIAVVPCRARGMSIKHNFQTAYFEIPEGLKHGDPLICSYPECRNRGVKFLYCTYCKDPVAKRNFRNRHNHGMTAEEDSKSRASTTAPAKVTSGSSASDGSGSASGKTIMKKRSVSAAGLSDGEAFSITSKLTRLESNDPDRVKAWQLLLVTRPQAEDEEPMSAWLMRVMAVSDTARPITEVLSNLELVPPHDHDEKPTEGSMTHSETEEDTNEDSNDTSGSGVKPESSSSASSPQEGPPSSSSNDSSNMDSNDSNDSNESSSDNGIQEDNDNVNEYSSEMQEPMGSSLTESVSSDDLNESSSSENNQEGLKRKFESMSSSSSDNRDEAETDKYNSSTTATTNTNTEGHQYSSQESGVSSSLSIKHESSRRTRNTTFASPPAD